jgi:hypothetical protein
MFLQASIPLCQVFNILSVLKAFVGDLVIADVGCLTVICGHIVRIELTPDATYAGLAAYFYDLVEVDLVPHDLPVDGSEKSAITVFEFMLRLAAEADRRRR